MKNLKHFLVFFTINIFGLIAVAKAQKGNPENIKQLVESQNYVFKADVANPQSGDNRQLSPGYDLTVTKNRVVAYLPYFGRAYTTPIDPSENGIKFTSTDFEYKLTRTAKGWEITIRPKDARDVQQLYLLIYDNGNASLDVMTINRQGISFSGHIR